MRSFLVHVHDDSCLDARLKVAVDLARSFDGHLTCLHATPYEFFMPNDVYGTLIAQMAAEQRSNAARMHETLNGKLADSGVEWDWMEQEGMVVTRLFQQAGLSDLVLLGACDEETGEPGYSSLPGELAIETQTPVMVVPQSSSAFDVTAPAVVAWKGTSESSRALRAAVPLLAKAASVDIVTSHEAGSSDYDVAAEAAQTFLSHHGIASQVTKLEDTSKSVATDLNEFTQSKGAGLIVMGAFGQSRLRQRVFGGVTREMLSNVQVPLFLCH
ncbi:universal stress protein [Altericroceibacterium spongiae]|nr:universal stress protein [Altericroceibacterium spongiae]